ncbi:NAD kinase [Halalkalibacter sp. AB-rgal2]|uniref:NAD kinase n=1 Tax=Halalkalibacter sp. AB-rgal2 TaxID=3242695 RepID=UPI00359D19AA
MQKIYLFYKKTSEMDTYSKLFRSKAKERNIPIVDHLEDATFIASIGGDNAFLQAAQKTNFSPQHTYIGITPDPTTGFYTDFTMNDLDLAFQMMTNEHQSIRSNPILQVIINDETPFYCLNECTIRSNVIKTFVLDVYIDQFHFETFRGDGMIISTPSGSTGYSKSVRGAIIDPTLSSIQVSEIASLNNNHYRTLGTSFVLNADRILTLKVIQDGNDHPIIGVDNEALSIRHAKEVSLSLADHQIHILQKDNYHFWRNVQQNFF